MMKSAILINGNFVDDILIGSDSSDEECENSDDNFVDDILTGSDSDSDEYENISCQHTCTANALIDRDSDFDSNDDSDTNTYGNINYQNAISVDLSTKREINEITVVSIDNVPEANTHKNSCQYQNDNDVKIRNIEMSDLKWEFKALPINNKTSDAVHGPTFEKINSSTSCLVYFSKMISKSTVEIIVHETNRYAKQKLKISKCKNKKWKSVTIDEIYAYFGCRILMGISKLPSIDLYWSNDNDIGTVKIIRDAFTRDIFESIERNIHCVNNNDYKKIKKLIIILIICIKLL